MPARDRIGVVTTRFCEMEVLGKSVGGKVGWGMVWYRLVFLEKSLSWLLRKDFLSLRLTQPAQHRTLSIQRYMLALAGAMLALVGASENQAGIVTKLKISDGGLGRSRLAGAMLALAGAMLALVGASEN